MMVSTSNAKGVLMSPANSAGTSKVRLWTGRITTAIPILMLLFSGVAKLMKSPTVVEGFARYGYPENLLTAIGILEIACIVIYAIPRTAVLGAILVAAYLGGATATNVRVGDPSFFIPAVLGVLAWIGLYLRDERLQALLPLRRPSH
jgi:hypothetical protein